MTNITLSIEGTVHKRMRNYSEIKWSEFVRKAIKQRLDELDTLERHPGRESILTMFASEDVLQKDWENPADARWDRV